MLERPDYNARTVVIRDPALRQFDGGFTALPNRVLRNGSLSLGARMTYAMLLNYAWQKDFCWPAQQQLGRDLGLKPRMIRYHLDELRRSGLVDWKRQGLNRPNIYYILALPNDPRPDDADQGDNGPRPDRQYFATPDRQSISAQERQSIADKEYSKKNTKNVNVISSSHNEDDDVKARQDYLVSEILAVCKDSHSTGFYRRIAKIVPADLIFEAIAETNACGFKGQLKKTHGALFTSLVKQKALRAGIDILTG